jgi:hypothetical protein
MGRLKMTLIIYGMKKNKLYEKIINIINRLFGKSCWK